MINKITTAFILKLNAITPTIQTAYEGVQFTPTVGVPYQEVYILPAVNAPVSISSPNYMSEGIFQINIRYPYGEGTGDIMDRVNLYMSNFKKDEILTRDGLTIKLSTPSYRSLGKDGDRIVYAFTVDYQAFVNVV